MEKKYNEPTITGRIYQKGSFININEFSNDLLICKPSYSIYTVVNLSSVMFTSKIEENESGLYIKDLKFVDTPENKMLLELFKHTPIGISARSTGEVVNNIVENATLIGVDLIINPSEEANANYDFTFCGNEPELMLEFEPEDRYGNKYLNIKSIFFNG